MVVVVYLVGWSCFFVGATVGLIVGLTIDRAVSLTIGGIVLMGTDVAVYFSRLFLW